MAIRHSRRIHLVALVVVALSALACLIPGFAFATPKSPAAPRTVAEAQKQLTDLMRTNSQLVDKYNQARIDVAAKQRAADAARSDAAAAAAAFAQARSAVSATVVAQYEGGSFSAAGALLSSHSGQGYLDQLQALNMISEHNAGVAKQLDVARIAAVAATKQADGLLAAATKRSDELAAQKRTVDGQFAKYTALLASLTAAQRATYQQTIAPTVTSAVVQLTRASLSAANVPGAAKKAVDYALAQLGKPYVYGAAGPDAFDCSGLTMAAYATAGIGLPHNAAAQYDVGRHVSISALQPGDLIFYYQPIGHVVIYVGGGMAVSASTEGVPISEIPIASWDSNQISGATRIVG
ncbi:MAG: peptidoglycan DL-endopeptidase CwlO [Pseudonocardiales bacterium]|nr:peptidoglycan DL-endopeptidase CwlO [Pseudonocardiales bacterium]